VAAPAGVATAGRASPVQGVRAVAGVVEAQQRLDGALARARSGRGLSAPELLALQAEVYTASQQLDLAGKLVEKAAGGLKQVLQTQL
jgi:hypothetical protein